jgi:hypothetical protein
MRAAGDVSNCVGEALASSRDDFSRPLIETAKTIAFQRMTAKMQAVANFLFKGVCVF